jgi:hypothetical protein
MLMSKEVTPLCRMPEANKNNDPKCWWRNFYTLLVGVQSGTF